MLHVYIDKISNYELSTDIYPKDRLSEILSCNSQKVRDQKYASWKLLEYALKTSLNLNLNELSFTKTENGKWECDSAYFSISHSDDLVCVAVSSAPVGIDIEKFRTVNADISNKILTDDERNTYNLINEEDKNDYLLAIWTAKESIYKFSSDIQFSFNNLSVFDYSIKTQKISAYNKDYYLSICSENIIKNNIKRTLL